jgi:hypothetical protein
VPRRTSTRWRRVLIYTHRWLGIFGGLLFVMWFASGILMMYAGMPNLDEGERSKALPPLDLSAARLSPAEAAHASRTDPDRLRIGMLNGRPVYRFAAPRGWRTVFADNGERLTRLTENDAVALARPFEPASPGETRHDALLLDSDQWTFGVRSLVPLHRIVLGDPRGTHVYISDQTGDVVMKTTASSRRWGFLSAVLHWIYFTPFRRQATLWSQTIICLSIAGCVLSLSGLAWGIWRYSTKPRYRLKHLRSRTPYAGLMRWHHYAGLVFGLATFTWIFSGLLSMDPWNWSPGTAPTRQQREAVSGGPLRLEGITTDGLRRALATISSAPSPYHPANSPVKELEVVQFQGKAYLRTDHRIVSAIVPEDGVITEFDRGDLVRAAHAAMPGVGIDDEEWIREYDGYYYDRTGRLALPVLRVRYNDAPRTWLYLDPRRGTIVRKEERLSRLNRWLYHGLHSLDFPFLYYRRPLWDAVVIVLSLGGLLISASTLLVGWRRLRRHGRRMLSRMRSQG